MKTLVLARHAKSSWNQPGLPDFERPLNRRGESDAPRMARRLGALGLPIEAIVASPAVRAATTARALAAGLGVAEAEIRWEREIYGAYTERLLGIIAGFDDADAGVLMVGHNPGFGDLAQHWERGFLHNLPTCGIVHLELDCDRWSAAPAAPGRMVEFLYPKQEADD